MKTVPIPVLFVATFLITLFLNTGSEAQSDTLWYGHRAFGEGRYNDAIDAYQAAIDEGAAWTWLPDLIETVEIRRELGAISPPDTHNILVIFIEELNEISGTDTLTSIDVTAEQKANWKINFNVFRQTLESFSAGKWTVMIDSIHAISTYPAASNLAPDNPDHLNISQDFFSTMADYDSYITFSNTRSPARGLARRYPYVNGVLYGPHRGMAAINAGTHGYDILLHEFFHIVEWVSNAIDIPHGFEDAERDHFPGWTGETEFDYYRWHFQETLTKYPWQRLNHRTRWRPFESHEENLEAIVAAYEGIALADRQKADTLYEEGMALRSTDFDLAAAKWEVALALSPYHLASMVEVYDYYRTTNGHEAAAAAIYARLKMVRSVTGFYELDTLNMHYGSAIGMWYREDVTGEWAFFDWHITPYVSSSGCYEITFYYTGGFKALDIDSVSLWENDREIALDAHIGLSGNTKKDITYLVNIPDYSDASTYILKAKIKGNGGVDSYGQLQAIHTSDTCIGADKLPLGIEGHLPQDINVYPNPTDGKLVLSGAANEHIQIIDSSGKLYFEGRTKSDTEVLDLKLGKGLYYIRFLSGGARVKRFLIK